MSMLPKYEAANTAYKDMQGNRIDNLLDFVKNEAGFNIIRLRLFVNPTGATGVVQDLNYVKTFGKRIKNAGLKLMLDFHYSDSWADPSNQWTPEAWTNLSDEELYQKIYDYTKACLEAMNEAGATPDFIQTGNEISYGMLWGDKKNGQGKRCYTSSDANWPRFRSLLTQAGKACREVCPDAKIIIHTERTNNVSTTKGVRQGLAIESLTVTLRTSNLCQELVGPLLTGTRLIVLHHTTQVLDDSIERHEVVAGCAHQILVDADVFERAVE